MLTTAPGNGAPIGGLKVVAENGWFAARPSGTEDVYKLYAESFRGEEHLERILAEAQEIVKSALDGRRVGGAAGRLRRLAPVLGLLAAACSWAARSLLRRPRTPRETLPPGQRVVVVGGGFGGLQAVKKLRRMPVEVTLIDRRNFHLFQPLVYQVATGALSPGEIATPLRSIFKRARNVRVLLGEVGDVDLERRVVSVLPPIEDMPAIEVPYDMLIVAGGSKYSYFGHPEWAEYAPEIKSLERALDVRYRILRAFEAAELETDPSGAPSGSRSWSWARARPASRWPARSPSSRATRCRATTARSTRARGGSCSSRRASACSPASRPTLRERGAPARGARRDLDGRRDGGRTSTRTA